MYKKGGFMKKINYTQQNQKYMQNFVKNNILYNSYYENVKEIYKNTQQKGNIISLILKCFYDYDCYFSLFTIMNSIEEFLTENENIKTIEDVLQSKNFDIKNNY